MRRAVDFTEGLARWWDMQAVRRTVPDSALQEGLAVYAYKQAAAERFLAKRWTGQFAAVRKRAEEYLKLTYLQPVLEYSLSTTVSHTPESTTRELLQPSAHVDLQHVEDQPVELALEDPAYDFDFDEYE